MKNIYYIGGSPCSGKSTITEIISKKFDLYYFKVDDYLEKYMEQGAAQGKPVCSKVKSMTPEQIWMRDPKEQNKEELQIYNEIYEYILEDISMISGQSGIIAEGAAFIPSLIKYNNVDQKHYISITPTPEFQISHYKERAWVPYVLEGCSDKDKAFMNWMNRDILYAKVVREQSITMGYTAIVNDGSFSINELEERVCNQFDLESLYGKKD